MALSALAAFSLGTQAFGSILSAGASIQEGQQKAQIAEFNAKIDERNAVEVELNANFQAGLIENQAISDKQFLQFQRDLVKAESKAELIESAFRVHNQRLLNRRDLSTQRAKVAASGIAIGGSALEIMSETASIMEMGVMEIQRESRIKQQGLELEAGLLERQTVALGQRATTEIKLTRRAGTIRARDLREQATITRIGGQIAKRAGVLNAASNIISGASRFGQQFLSFRQAGVIA